MGNHRNNQKLFLRAISNNRDLLLGCLLKIVELEEGIAVFLSFEIALEEEKVLCDEGDGEWREKV